MGKVKDLTGQRFGRLVVVGRGDDYISPKGRRRPRWLCMCDCGGSALVQSGNLHNGRTQSCGCLQKELARVARQENGNPNKPDLTGERFGHLLVSGFSHCGYGGQQFWRCLCDCGNETIASTSCLRSGNTQSCGCYQRDRTGESHKKHGKSHKSRLYAVWVGMRQRCNDKNHRSYRYYGGRGISVCPEWDDYEAFENWALQNGYDPEAEYGECTIDRIDVNGNYEPGNCRWADAVTQANNKR